MKFNRINPELSVGNTTRQHIRVAILDLYNNEPNEGMRCIQQLLNQFPLLPHQSLSFKIYDVRFRYEVPGLDYDIFISTGGPGSPMEENNSQWERLYFRWVADLFQHNMQKENRKHAIFICHSFQLLCRFLEVGEISKRHSTAFGIFPIHKTYYGKMEPLFHGLEDPFYAVDSRDWQVVRPDEEKMEKSGYKILAIEKVRPHVPYERALMAVRFTDEITGMQFHPEADPVGMKHYLLRDDKKEVIIKHHGEAKYSEMLQQLDDPDKLNRTSEVVLPNFLKAAIDGLCITAPQEI